MSKPKDTILLNDCISSDAPICYGILKPGPEVSGGVPVVKVKNFSNGSIDASAVIHTSNEIDEQYKRSRLRAGDIILGIRGSTGNVAIVPPELEGANITQDSARIRIAGEEDRDYIYYVLKSPSSQKYIRYHTIGQAVKGINIADVRKLPVYWPPNKKRTWIVNHLAYWTNAVALAELLIAAKQEQRKGIMQQLLSGKRRFPGFTKPWQEVRLSEVLRPRKEKAVPSEEMPLYSLTIESGVTAKTDRYNREFLVKDKGNKKYKIVHPEDIVFNPANLRWGAIARSKVHHKVVVSPIYEVLEILVDRVDPDFVSHVLTSSRQVSIYATKTEGTLVERMAVKLDAFLLLKLLMPQDIEEQKRIAQVFNLLDKEISLLQQQLDAFKEQKKGLMQQLLTGKVQVKPAKEAVA